MEVDKELDEKLRQSGLTEFDWISNEEFDEIDAEPEVLDAWVTGTTDEKK